MKDGDASFMSTLWSIYLRIKQDRAIVHVHCTPCTSIYSPTLVMASGKCQNTKDNIDCKIAGFTFYIKSDEPMKKQEMSYDTYAPPDLRPQSQ